MPPPLSSLTPILECAIDHVNLGIFIINARREIVLWNRFMEINSGLTAESVVGRDLFECFPELPRNVVENKIKSVLILKSYAFSGWEQRPYLFKFRHNRPVTGGVEYMYQDCTFIPLKGADGRVDHICVTVTDSTDTALYKRMHKEALASLADASHRDGLTGVYNRRYLEETLSKEFNRAQRYGGSLSLIMIDIDDFKLINDNHGHLCGDEILRTTAKRLQGLIRQADTLGRYGGEEFGILLPETELSGAYDFAERIRSGVADAAILAGDIAIQMTISIGVAQHHDKMSRYEDLIRDADLALYEAKNGGRNCVRCADRPPLTQFVSN